MDWIGGFFDADGSASLVKRKRKGAAASVAAFQATVCFSQSDYGLLAAVKETIGGGNLRCRAKAGETNEYGVRNNRDAYQLIWTGSDAVRVLQLIFPYSIGKRKEISEIIAFHQRFNNYTKGFKNGGEEYLRRVAEMEAAGDECQQSLRHIRATKNTEVYLEG